jgi:two-component system OmpR family sensor kinase
VVKKQAEVNSLIRFVIVYTLFVVGILFLWGYSFYHIKKREILDSIGRELTIYGSFIKGNPTLLTTNTTSQIEVDIFKIEGNRCIPVMTQFPFQCRLGEVFDTPTLVGERLLYSFSILKKGNLYRVVLGATIPPERLRAIWGHLLLNLVIIGGGLLILFFLFYRFIFAPYQEAMNGIEEFVRDVTHEMNTPIMAIMNNLEMVKLFEPHCYNDYLKRIELGVNRLYTIFKNLSYLKLVGELKREPTLIRGDQEVLNRIREVEELAREKGLLLRWELEPTYIYIDREDFNRLVGNLLSNSLKYTQQGKIEVKLKNGVLEVVDTGVGIPKRELKRVTQKFVRASDWGGGFGLGLYIVKKIVRFYQLGFKIESREGVGTRVTIDLGPILRRVDKIEEKGVE